jgi:hypothetical protein
VEEKTTGNTVFTSWLFLGLGKCILPTTFVLAESFLASMPPRGQHPTVSGNLYAETTLLDSKTFLFNTSVLNDRFYWMNLQLQYIDLSKNSVSQVQIFLVLKKVTGLVYPKGHKHILRRIARPLKV